MGPILIFDKSFLQGLNPDESAFLDQFFLSNITPLFYIETLADLEKEVRAGRTPEQVVGSIAYKTPDLNAQPNVSHFGLIAGETMGAGPIDMRYGRPIIGMGRHVRLEGKKGVVFEPAPEQQAMERWRKGEFLQIERLQAKAWRQGLGLIDPKRQRGLFHKWVEGERRPRSLAEAKLLADSIIDGPERAASLEFGLSLLGVAPEYREKVMKRWREAGEPPIENFAPYFRHVFGVDLFFYLGLSSDLISQRRTNKVDIAYLYYLPFCMVFTSSDKIHADTVPLFLRPFQTFVLGRELKEDLARLDRLYSLVPDDVQERGLSHFAQVPPADRSFLVSQLWDKYMIPDWSADKNSVGRDPERDAATVAHLNKMAKAPESEPTPPGESSDDASYMIVHRRVQPRRGKWNRFPPEVLETQGSEPEDGEGGAPS